MKRLCRVAGCPNEPREGKKTCYRHRGHDASVCAWPKCRNKIRTRATHCRAHHNELVKAPEHVCRRQGCDARVSRKGVQCRPHANKDRWRKVRRRREAAKRKPKTPRAQLARQGAWKKMNPKGPPCVKCGELLSAPSQSKTGAPPKCMSCRVDEARAAGVFTSGASPAKFQKKTA